ncbi:MAG: phosphoethanolamine transferase [Fibrobacteres bacterium]|nr:phosphoethanolamine transferase [Fibrobacterota bacterium]
MVKIFKSISRQGILFAYLLITVADLFIIRRSSWIFEQVSGIRFWINYVFSSLIIFAILYFLRYRNDKILSKILFLILFAFPMLTQPIFFAAYDKFITPFGFSIFVSDTAMIFELGGTNLPVLQILFLIPVLILVYRAIFIGKAIKVRIWRPILIYFLGFSAFVHGVIGWFGHADFQHASSAFYINLTETAIRSSYSFKVDRVMPVATDIKAKKPRAIIFVIGESTVKRHMSLFGYSRKTTPGLDSLKNLGVLTTFNNAISVGNKTNLSVPYMLTGIEGPDPQGRFYRNPTIFDYAKANGYRTLFISAQELRWGNLDRVLAGRSVDILKYGSDFSAQVDILKGADDSVVLSRFILPYIDTVSAPFFMVYQMDGSHYPYNAHSPSHVKKFFPESEPNGINAYDNTILYTDRNLTKLITALKMRFPDGIVTFSQDHGQGLSGHAGYNDNYVNETVENSLFISAPKALIDSLSFNSSSPVTQIDIFATLLDIWKQQPSEPIDGLSLFKTIPSGRLRICSEYMPTFHNVPVATIIFPNSESWQVDFSRKVVQKIGTQEAFPYSSLPDSISLLLDSRLRKQR